jgi:hypothetical protein
MQTLGMKRVPDLVENANWARGHHIERQTPESWSGVIDEDACRYDSRVAVEYRLDSQGATGLL